MSESFNSRLAAGAAANDLRAGDLHAGGDLPGDVRAGAVKISTDAPVSLLREQAMALRPWRKGPFLVGDLLIDSEWRSDIKISILHEQLLLLDGKRVADIGCNNGFYMFKMLEYRAREVVGFDPSARCAEQFAWLNSYAKSPIIFEQKTAAELPEYAQKTGKFDVIFCLGVLYHRPDPFALLKQLKAALNPGGFCIIDSLIIERDEPIALVPQGSYAGMSNAYLIPSPAAICAMAARAKFSRCEQFARRATTTEEQRKTEWITGFSLEEFASEQATKEGYAPPIRGYFRLDL